ncbi:MAG: hypothetical protein JWN44_7134 [Myxococcales bacterium]|nr:hypothetical protein [Myxococcales bacterium]
MSHHALEALVEQVRSLPGAATDLGLPRAAVREAATPPSVSLDTTSLRARTAAWLTALAARIETVLPVALARATQAWDQADAVEVFDDGLREEAIALRRAAEALANGDAALANAGETRAAGLEAQLMIDAAAGLGSLLERRFASILRLRLRSATPALLVDGRPFVDVAAALAEAGRRWR